jgi:hypothetical protein
MQNAELAWATLPPSLTALVWYHRAVMPKESSAEQDRQKVAMVARKMRLSKSH